MAELLGMDEPRKHIAAMISGLDIRYDLGEGYPLLGRRMPDLDLRSADGPGASLHVAPRRTSPSCSTSANPAASTSLLGRIASRLVHTKHKGTWELPVLGEIDPPTAVLIRPDGYVAWVGDGTDTGLRDALTTWFGSP